MVHIFRAYLRECPLLPFNSWTTGVSICYCPLSVVRHLLKDIGHVCTSRINETSGEFNNSYYKNYMPLVHSYSVLALLLFIHIYAYVIIHFLLLICHDTQLLHVRTYV